jgi:hypothetical protein
MIVDFFDGALVVSVRPDPVDPLNVSIVKLNDGETIRVRGEHTEVADKLRTAAATIP